MSHLTEDRLLELSLEPDLHPSADEADHLEGCADCTRRLAEERELTTSLESMAFPVVTEAFVSATTARFTRARELRRARRITLALFVSLIASFFVAIPLLLAAIQSAASIARGLALAMADAAKVLDASLTLLVSVPVLSMLSIAALAAVLLFFAGTLTRLGRETAGEISGVVGP